MAHNPFPSPCIEWIPGLHLKKLTNASFHWAPILKWAITGVKALRLNPIRGVVFSGPPGNGRHTYTEALCGSLMNYRCNYFLRISGAALDCEDVAGACAAIDTVAGELNRRQRLCLLLDSPELSRHCQAIQEYLYQLLLERGDSLFVVLITDNPGNISPNLLRMLMLCHCPKPDLGARQLWFENALKAKPALNIDGMDHWQLARETDNFSWKQIQDLRFLLYRSIAVKYYTQETKYNPTMDEAVCTQVLTSGQIHLGKSEVMDFIHLIRAQNTSPAPAMAQGPIQFVAAPGTGAILTSQEPQTPMDKETADALIAKHKDIQNMDVDVLVDVDDL